MSSWPAWPHSDLATGKITYRIRETSPALCIWTGLTSRCQAHASTATRRPRRGLVKIMTSGEFVTPNSSAWRRHVRLGVPLRVRVMPETACPCSQMSRTPSSASTRTTIPILAMVAPNGVTLATTTISNCESEFGHVMAWITDHAPGDQGVIAVEGTRSCGVGLTPSPATGRDDRLEIDQLRRGVGAAAGPGWWLHGVRLRIGWGLGAKVAYSGLLREQGRVAAREAYSRWWPAQSSKPTSGRSCCWRVRFLAVSAIAAVVGLPGDWVDFERDVCGSAK